MLHYDKLAETDFLHVFKIAFPASLLANPPNDDIVPLPARTKQIYFWGLYRLEDGSACSLTSSLTIRVDVKTPKAGRVSEKDFWADHSWSD